VSASSTSSFFKARASASCGGQSIACEASSGESCSATSQPTASGGAGTCNFNGSSGSGSCAASGGGGGGGPCFNAVVTCVPCPTNLCNGGGGGGGTPGGGAGHVSPPCAGAASSIELDGALRALAPFGIEDGPSMVFEPPSVKNPCNSS
jgi:hypothetical protein